MFTRIWNVLRGRYVALLEEEVERLRGENRALMNSLLGTAGFPPVELAAEVKPVGMTRLRKRSWHQMQVRKEMEASGEGRERA